MVFIFLKAFLVLAFGSSLGSTDTFKYGDRDGNLFLDVSISEAQSDRPEWGLVEPWTSDYIVALQENRYGDAIWARYQMFGDTSNGTYLEYPQWTVREAIEEDAIGYRLHARDNWKYAMTIYAKSNRNIQSDILDLMFDVDRRSYYRLFRDQARLHKRFQQSEHILPDCDCKETARNAVDSVVELK
ncbi:hypothetical protein FOQG_13521 [Fusarium oxysporum f. sp. raphani 54005]|uniref:Uncharacterized protein n=6 Tax=Fusarium oxysporum TaxID=5507 RepID=N4U986_FUSC1|nr:hypothetical protein FOC1_g10003642 [Fusarium oxysporum f. sp. cubense race 1]EXK82135.1 hypothetical protein FOQG_13521 [Fusarium oxysporum f. sp. raphani 54005]EXL70655.1 hypothetical protein FOPG_13515 [Fusarium oxysporum f. sp. conglutinans race 2 54008]EXM18629.1 hypothetical protein FOTG_13330 [Fusarium oxysporum f. sp. vasinfectum 25433]KAG7425965.1 hypothetical protein Forpi1262_v012616 [Fusarium oxysporum f. sp. raphani]KAK2668644.1 hypothetical protein RAB80_016024 [Fusarium oxysp